MRFITIKKEQNNCSNIVLLLLLLSCPPAQGVPLLRHWSIDSSNPGLRSLWSSSHASTFLTVVEAPR